jgi:hypothetical protein
MKTLAPKMAKTFNPSLAQLDAGTLSLSSNKTEIFWQGLPPMIVPILRPLKETNGT